MDDVLGQANLEIVVKPRCKMSKRPVTFNKPEDPSFLKQIKASIGYKDGPTVDTKRQKFEDCNSDEDDEGQLDYKPQVVVVRAGDLTEEEAEREKQRLLREEQEKPADLSQRVVFKKPPKKQEAEEANDQSTDSSNTGASQNGSKGSVKPKKDKRGTAKPPSKLSFAEDDAAEEDF